jgi:hypothetical protein
MGPLDALKAALDVAKSINNLELQRQLIDVQGQILDLQLENAGLKEKLRSTEDFKTLSVGLEFDKNCYWRPVGDKKEGPFCSPCLDTKRVLVRMHQLENGYARCPSCDSGTQLEPSPPLRLRLRHDFDPLQ